MSQAKNKSINKKNPVQKAKQQRQPSQPYTMLAPLTSAALTDKAARTSIGEKNIRDHEELVRVSSLLSATPGRIKGEQQSLSSWRKAVHQYISHYNEAEVEQYSLVLLEKVRDQEHHSRLINRLERVKERELLRGAWPTNSETKGELIRVHESAEEVNLLLKLHIKKRMQQNDIFYIEERFDYERLWLRQQGEEWEIVQVEPVIYERRPRFGDAAHDTVWIDESDAVNSVMLTPSVPYLNYELMAAYRPMRNQFIYKRDLAVAYADRWWNEGNPRYEQFEVNCTHYVSQCIFAGNAPMNYTGKRSSGWWYRGRDKGQELWSYSWAVSHAMNTYLAAARKSGLRAQMVSSADQLSLGDVITYDWAGDGRFQHSTIVTAFDAFGMPLVNANTVPSRHRYWDYSDSYAWTPNTQYRFFHIISD
ncbi:amidase domain-containing protein [Paenibacillus sp. GXUN7292]|uniref:amidase domain-containing protein n=1 Tax=Paenibacillus sp. GXUN7292 TaxID=3422499 RepID=UPI003D7EFCE3